MGKVGIATMPAHLENRITHHITQLYHWTFAGLSLGQADLKPRLHRTSGIASTDNMAAASRIQFPILYFCFAGSG
jgi:hypothetical protein